MEPNPTNPNPTNPNPTNPNPTNPNPTNPNPTNPNPTNPNPANPYPANPYPAGPYPASPYAASPYAVGPYPANPYPTNPYPTNPYPTNPYQGVPPLPETPPRPNPPRRGKLGWWVAGISGALVVVLICVLVVRQVLPLVNGGQAATPTPNLAASQVFQYNLPIGGGRSDIQTLDPDIMTDANAITVANLIYDGLVELDQNNNVEDWGARRVDISPDGLTYTFHLRPGQEFANGTPVTAQDYAYSMNRTLDPCLASHTSYYLFALQDASTLRNETCTDGEISNPSGPMITTLIGDSINTPDSQTLVITLAQPAAYFEEAMTYPTSWAVDPTVVGSDPTSEAWLDQLTSGIGTSGMYQVAKWNHAGGSIVLTANPHWWGLSVGKKPYLTEIDFTLFGSHNTAYAAYQAGQFDVGFPTPDLVAKAKTQPDFHEVGDLAYFGVDFNWTQAPFDNEDARIAACLAINRIELNNTVLHGEALPHWNIVPKGMPGYNPNVTGPDGVTSLQGDTAKAAAHWQTYLASEGASAVTTWTYLYDTQNPTYTQMAKAFQSMWETALPGVTVTLKGVDFNTWEVDAKTGNFTSTRYGWYDDYPDPQDFLSLLFTTGAQQNAQQASMPDADALMAQADADSNQKGRIATYNQVEQLLINAVATCPLYQDLSFYQVRACVHNWTPSPAYLGAITPLDSWLRTYIDPSCPNA